VLILAFLALDLPVFSTAHFAKIAKLALAIKKVRGKKIP